MDIMDSSDTPTGGLDQSSSSSSSALPLSVDQTDAFASPTNRSTYGGQEPTSSAYSFSSGSAALDRMDAAARVDDMPTSTDDIMMPRVDFASHPSLTGSGSGVPSVSVHTEGKPVSEQAKQKAAGAMDAAKDKAADAKVAASDMAGSAKVKAAAMQDKVEDATDSMKDKLADTADKAKVGAAHLFDQVKASLHSAERTVEDKYEQVKEDLSERSAGGAHKATAPTVRSTVSVEATDTHPAASSMRDAHLHPGLSSLPSHGNEQQADKGNAFMSNSHHNALIAGDEAHARALADSAAAEPKDASASRGLLARMHDKLEDGAEAVKERVDGFMEQHVRRDNDEHLSAAAAKDLPTLIDSSNTHNTSMVRAKMHPSAERTLSGADQDD